MAEKATNPAMSPVRIPVWVKIAKVVSPESREKTRDHLR